MSYTRYWGRCRDHIDCTITHAFEVFKTRNIILKHTHVAKRPRFEPVHVVKLVDTTSEKPIDDLVVGVKQIIMGDWSRG
jgi:hypothetical protein